MSRFFRTVSQFFASSSLKPSQLAVDWGHSRIRVVKNGQLVFNQPSCYLEDDKTGAVLSLGQEAWQMSGRTPPDTSLVFPVKQGSVYDLEQGAAFIRGLWRKLKLAPRLPGINRSRVLLAVPNQAAELDKKLWAQVFSEAGVDQIRFVAKGEALIRSLPAAYQQGCNLLLLDVGAELTELTLCIGGEAVGLFTVGLGGRELSSQISQKLLTEHQLKVSGRSARQLKHQLSSGWLEAAGKGEVSADNPAGLRVNVRGVDAANNLVLTKTIEQRALYPLMVEWGEQLVKEIKLVFTQLEPEMLVEAFDNGCFIAGGSCQLSGLEQFLAKELKTEVISAQDLVLAVVNVLIADFE